MYDFSAEIALLYGDGVEVYCPPRLHYKSTIEIKPSEQESIYKAVLAEKGDAPVSMMNDEKLFLLMELLRYALRSPGDIVEMGVYQGGSAWYLAKILTYLGETRHMFLIDLFESHMMHQNATMCNDEITRRLHFYPHLTLLEGLVDDQDLLSRLGNRPLCFAHYDLGPHPRALEHIWSNLVPGAPLILDNYGHLAASPAGLERFFGDRGTRVIRLPWSEQGIVFKHAG
jgi:predicted O-methyltransferase YrrM